MNYSMADVVMTASESRDGTGAADHDCPYVWGHPREFLTIRAQARLTILRGYCMDTKRGGEERNCASGDLDCLDHAVLLPSGLIVPARPAA